MHFACGRLATAACRLRRYKLLEFIKAGGMAEVFRAETDIGKAVALKLLKPDLTGDTDARLRFLEEARLAAKSRCGYAKPLWRKRD
jgi:serine/threonine protein kinase